MSAVCAQNNVLPVFSLLKNTSNRIMCVMSLDSNHLYIHVNIWRVQNLAQRCIKVINVTAIWWCLSISCWLEAHTVRIREPLSIDLNLKETHVCLLPLQHTQLLHLSTAVSWWKSSVNGKTCHRTFETVLLSTYFLREGDSRVTLQ